MKSFAVALVLTLAAALSLAQSMDDKPYVIMAPVGNVQMHAGATKDINLAFRVGSEYHINSHKPNSPLLIPTILKLDTTSPLALGDVKYPAGQDMSFAFSGDEKLNVYSGDFTVDAFVKAPSNAVAGTYPVKGSLRFQACDHSACYPPRSIPVEFQVTVAK
jgi:Thiol:disulfide interchange protein DsbD, N-terminal